MNIQIRVLAARARAETAALRREMEALERAQGNVGRAGARTSAGLPLMSKWGNQVQWAGRQLQYNFTLPLVLAGAAATKFALDNERAMTRVIKVYGDGSEAMDRLARTEIPALERAFEALSSRYGVIQSQVIEIAGDWAAAGASGIALAKSVKLTLETMILGEMEAAEATEALIAIQAQYGLNTEELIKTLAVLNIVENQTGISMSGLVQGFQRAAGVARSAGIDVEHLAAMMAALVPAAGSAANAGNALKTIISRLLSPTKEAAQVMGLMGVNTQALGWQSMNGAERLETMAKAFVNLDDAQKAVVSSTVASRWQINRFDVLMRDIVNTNGYYQKALQASSNDTAVFKTRQDELNAVLSSNPRRLDIMWNVLRNAMADVVQPLLPMIVSLASEIASLAKSFADLDPSIQKMVLASLAALAAIGFITRYIGSLMVLAGLLQFGFAAMASGSVIAAKGLVGLAAVPFSAIAAGFGALLGAVASMNVLLFAGMARLAPTIGAAISAIAVTITPLVTALGASIMGAWTAAMAIVRAGLFRATVSSFALSIIAALGVAFMAANASLQLFLFTGVPALISRAYAPILWASTRLWMALSWALTAQVMPLMIAFNSMLASVSALFYRGFAMVFAGAAAMWAAVHRAYLVMMVGLWGRLVMLPATIFAVLAGGRALVYRGALLMWSGLLVVTRAIPLLIASTGPLIIAAAKAAWAGLLLALTSPIGLAIIAGVTLFALFKDEIIAILTSTWRAVATLTSGLGSIFAPLGEFFSQLVEWITDAFWRLPAGVRDPLLAVLRVVQAIALQIYEWMSYLNPFARHSPSLVESVTMGMNHIANQYGRIGNVRSIFAAAARDLQAFRKAAEGLSLGEWADERADIAILSPGVLGLFDRLLSHLSRLNILLAEQRNLITRQEQEVRRWKTALDAADKAVEGQRATLDGLRGRLEALTAAYDRHKTSLDNYASAPITGMRAMSDAIFANEMAQKRLRLEMLRFEQANGSVEDLRNRLSLLQGDIERLRGEASDLRSAGAGSDILGPINAEIAAMEAQHKALSGAVAATPVDAMRKELEALQQQGEILDLENSLKFDPLTRQIEQLASGMQELPFDQIINGVTRERAAMDALQPSIDQATLAVERQEQAVRAAESARESISRRYEQERDELSALNDAYDETSSAIREIEQALNSSASAAADQKRALEDARRSAGAEEYLSPGAQNFLDAAGGNFPDVGGMARIDREGGLEDQSALIDQFTADMNAELAGMFSEFDMFEPIRRKWNEFTGWWSANVSPAWREMTSGIAGAFTGAEFSGLRQGLADTWASVQVFWNNVTGWIGNIASLFGPQLSEIWTKIVEGASGAWEDISRSLEGFSELGGPIIEALKNIGRIALVGILALIGVFSLLWSVIGEIIQPIFKMIGDIISGAIDIIRGLVKIIVGIFTLDMGLILGGVKDIFSGLVEIIWGILDGAVSIIWGIIRGLVEGIWDFFKWLFDVLVGNSIIPDMIDSIINFFSSLPGKVITFVSNLVNGVIGWFKDLSQKVVTEVLQFVISLLQKWIYFRSETNKRFQEIINGVMEKWNNLKTSTMTWIVSFLAGVIAKWVTFKNDTNKKFDEIRQGISDRITGVRSKVEEVIETLKTNIGTKADAIKSRFMAAFNHVRDNIGSVFDTITGKIKGGINSAIKAVNKLIDGLNKVADVLPGLNWNIAPVPLLATGGQIPGTRQVMGGFRTTGARAIVGEGKANHPEFVIPTDPTYRQRAQSLYAQLGQRIGMPPMLAGGGILTSIKGTIGKVTSGIKNGFDWAADAARGVATKFLDPFFEAAQDRIDNITWRYGREGAQSALSQFKGWATEANKAYQQTAESVGGNAGKLAGGAFSKTGGWPPANMSGYSSNAWAARNFVSGRWPAVAGIGGFAKRNISGTNTLSDHARGKAIDIMLRDYMSPSSKRLGTEISQWFVRNAGAYGTKYVIYYDQMNSGSGWRTYGHPGGGRSDTLQHRDHVHVSLMAAGGIVKSRRGGSLALLGESGQDEAVVPLPADWRGLFNVLRVIQRDGLKSYATARSAAAQGASRMNRDPGSLTPARVSVHTEYHFHGDLSFPNIKDGDDAETFLQNLDDLAGV